MISQSAWILFCFVLLPLLINPRTFIFSKPHHLYLYLLQISVLKATNKVVCNGPGVEMRNSGVANTGAGDSGTGETGTTRADTEDY